MRKRVLKYVLTPYYWVPYHLFQGYAIPPMLITLELTYRCNQKYHNCTISALNAHYLSELMDIANALDVHTVSDSYMFFTSKNLVNSTSQMIPIGQKKFEDQVLPENLRKINIPVLLKELKKIKEKSKRLGINVIFSPPLSNDEIMNHFFDEFYTFTTKCFYPSYSGRINPYGDVYPCSVDFSIGNTREKPFSQLWNNERYKYFRSALKRTNYSQNALSVVY